MGLGQRSATWACMVVGLALLLAFVRWELRVDQPLVPMRLFANRAFAVDNAVLFLLSICFVPLFFFAQPLRPDRARRKRLQRRPDTSSCSSAASRSPPSGAARILDARGARPTVVLGCAVAAVGFYLWANKLDDLSFASSGRAWRSPAPASAWCSGRSGPTR